MSRIYLQVPYAEKDAAKAMGARWDAKRKSWYVPSAAVLRVNPGLAQWMDVELDEIFAAPVRAGRISVSQLAQVERCEQQMVFDRAFGRARSQAYEAKGRAGLAEHSRYEAAVAGGAKPRATPCFVASAVFGQEAFETAELRRWRNERLRRSASGRAVIALYERCSPPLARWLATRPRLARLVARALRLFIGLVRG